MKPPFDVVTVTLHPAIDRTVEINDFTIGQVNRAAPLQSVPAGKGVNAASVLADYGQKVAVTGFLGRENCDPFETLFRQKKTEDRFVRIEGQTRVGLKIADPLRQQTTDINFPGPAPTAADLEELYHRIDQLEAPWFLVAGSLPPGLAVTVYRDLVARIKARGSRVALDASGESFARALEAGPDLIKPNIHELEELLGLTLRDDAAVVTAARQLVSQGIDLVVVSMGAAGACFVTNNEALIARPPAIEVRSTVGAGDAMVAGTVAGRLRGWPLERCARLATAFSMEALSRIEAGLSSPAAIESSMAQVAVV